MFLYEIHLHDRACSACGQSTVEEEVLAAKEKGLAGLVYTNHFYHGNTAIDRTLAWSDFVGAYADAYHRAKAFAKQHDIDILFGIEEGYGKGKEALIYGLKPEELIAEPEFVHMNIRQISAFVRQHNGFIACAHPFRVREYIIDPDCPPEPACFDGVEIFNYGNDFADNVKAAVYAQRHGLPGLSGGDVHHADRLGHSGLCFEARQTDEKQFSRSLKTQQYRLYLDGKIVPPLVL